MTNNTATNRLADQLAEALLVLEQSGALAEEPSFFAKVLMWGLLVVPALTFLFVFVSCMSYGARAIYWHHRCRTHPKEPGCRLYQLEQLLTGPLAASALLRVAMDAVDVSWEHPKHSARAEACIREAIHKVKRGSCTPVTFAFAGGTVPCPVCNHALVVEPLPKPAQAAACRVCETPFKIHWVHYRLVEALDAMAGDREEADHE